VHAVVVGGRDAEVDVEQMLEICAKELPTYMVPRGVEVVSALPTLPNGKVDYRQLRSERVSSL